MGRHTAIAIRMAFVTILAFGIVYPLVMTGLAQLLFPRQANGNIIKVHGKVIGSKLIGQQFTEAGYFHPRPSAAGNGYDAALSGGSNLGPTSKKLADTVRQRVKDTTQQNPNLFNSPTPVDMVTSSASGLDPDISVENAYSQLPRVAKARGMSYEHLSRLLDSRIIGRTLGFLGEPRVNVLEINSLLDAESGNL